MKKILFSLIGLSLLSGCTYYDYYKGDVRYTQDGKDCIYYASEDGNNFSREIRGLDIDKRIVYRNVRCEDLFNRDNIGQVSRNDRQIFVPAAQPVSEPVAFSGCNKFASQCSCRVQPTVTRKYYVVSAM